MAFRNIIIDSRCKLEYSMNYLICRKGLDEKKILLDEIKLIVINSTQCSITTTLISECLKKKIKIIFSDQQHNPCGELVPYKNNYYSYRKIKEQMAISEDNKQQLWTLVVKNKIYYQMKNLELSGKTREATMLENYLSSIELNDKTNCEGIAAKVYFQALFGKEFSRDLVCKENMYLDYGYSIILATFNRVIRSIGYFTELGIHHIGESNSFNFSCDLMEPLRPLVDNYVISGYVNDDNYRYEFVNMLTKEVRYDDHKTFLDNAIEEYVENAVLALKTGFMNRCKFIEYEL